MKVFRVLLSENAQRLLFFLCDRPMEEYTVSALAEETGVPVASTSRTMKVLRRYGYVRRQPKKGKERPYIMKREVAESVRDIRDAIDESRKVAEENSLDAFTSDGDRA